MQNKANVKMGKMTISTATTKAYAKKQRTMTNEYYSKQTQTNPKLEICSTLSEVEGPIKPNSPTRNPFFRPKIELCSTLSAVEGQISCPHPPFLLKNRYFSRPSIAFSPPPPSRFFAPNRYYQPRVLPAGTLAAFCLCRLISYDLLG
jgi:hypothetical protein